MLNTVKHQELRNGMGYFCSRCSEKLSLVLDIGTFQNHIDKGKK